MWISDKRRANIAKILINVGSIDLGTLVVPALTGSFNWARLLGGVVAAVLCFAGAIWIEK